MNSKKELNAQQTNKNLHQIQFFKIKNALKLNKKLQEQSLNQAIR